MEKIKLRVTGNQIEVTEQPAVITAGMVGMEAEFAFDSQWESLNKIAVFKTGDKVVSAALAGNTHTVPWEVLAKPNQWLSIGVYGANAKGTVVIPTLWAAVSVVHTGADPAGDPALEPTAPIWQELLDRVDNITPETIGAVSIDRSDEIGAHLQQLDNYTGNIELAMNNHINNADSENPHGVTWELVGAAPAGYGLGERSSFVDNWNAGYVNAFARSNSNSPDGKMWYGIVCRDAASTGTTTEIAFSMEAGNLVSEVRRSRNAAGTWGKWEYVNPPMLPGVEYRTTDRWNGKAVYTMLLDCGEAVDKKIVELEDWFGIIRVEGCIFNAEGIPICPLPNGQIAWLDTLVDVGLVTLYCNDDNYCGGEQTFQIRLWYVK